MSEDGTMGRGKRRRETFSRLPSCTSRVLFFVSQLEPLRRSGELPINKRQTAQRASGHSEDKAMAVSAARTNQAAA